MWINCKHTNTNTYTYTKNTHTHTYTNAHKHTHKRAHTKLHFCATKRNKQMCLLPRTKQEACYKLRESQVARSDMESSRGHHAQREAQEMRKWKGGLRCKERIRQLSIKGKREWAGVTGSEWLRDSGAAAQSMGGILSLTMAGDWVGRVAGLNSSQPHKDIEQLTARYWRRWAH